MRAVDGVGHEDDFAVVLPAGRSKAQPGTRADHLDTPAHSALASMPTVEGLLARCDLCFRIGKRAWY